MGISMLQFIQYLKGYVCIRVWGYSPERLMNLCSNHDILLWDIRNHGEYYTMCITVGGFRRLKPIVKKTGTRVAIQKRCGLPFFVPGLKRRKIFLLGLVGSFVFWMWMSTFIWAVELNGNYAISRDVFMDFLEENHIYVGMKRGKVDIEQLEKSIRQSFGIVTWTSARIKGTRLEIQIKENEVDTGGRDEAGAQKGVGRPAEDSGSGSDLVAQEDGTVVGMVTRKGIPQVSVGMDVKKGDVLVTGMVPVYNEDATIRKYQFYQADADVFISRRLLAGEELPLSYEQKEYTGEEKKEVLLGVLDKELVLRLGRVRYENYDRVTDKKQVRLLDNFYLPLYYGSRINREYVVRDNIYTKEEVKKIFSEKLINFMADLKEKGVQIMKKNVTINKVGNRWRMNMDFQIVEKTGARVPIVPEDTELPKPQTDETEDGAGNVSE
ncbi:MAG: sporulation protein YqfD [Lachnospiraceae bacterium]|nr:sporulation protein YqfD [Lachnospiraceae bacterium]